jgi:hypothetical protein
MLQYLFKKQSIFRPLKPLLGKIMQTTNSEFAYCKSMNSAIHSLLEQVRQSYFSDTRAIGLTLDLGNNEIAFYSDGKIDTVSSDNNGSLYKLDGACPAFIKDVYNGSISSSPLIFEEFQIVAFPLGNDATPKDVILYSIYPLASQQCRTTFDVALPLVAEAIANALFLFTASAEITSSKLAQRFHGLIKSSFADFNKLRSRIYKYVNRPSTCSFEDFHSVTEPMVCGLAGLSPPLSEREELMLRTVNKAGQITVIDRLEDSFRKDPVFKVKIKLNNGLEYPAIVKFSNKLQANGELKSFKLIQSYAYKDVRHFLPAFPEIFEWKDIADKYTVVCPEVDGISLARHIRKYWNGNSWLSWGISRSQFYNLIFRSCGSFLKPIQQEVESVNLLPHGRIYSNFFCRQSENVRAPRDIAKVHLAFRHALSGHEDVSHFYIMIGSRRVSFVNPFYFLNKFLDASGVLREQFPSPTDDALWKIKNMEHIVKQYWGHGDYHTGNILIDDLYKPPAQLEGFHISYLPRPVILDYDFVGKKHEFFDEATLEASFVLDISSPNEFADFSYWSSEMPRALEFQVNPTFDNMIQTIESYRIVYDLAHSLWPLRNPNMNRILSIVPKFSDDYKASLVVALFRLIGSHFNGLMIEGEATNVNKISKYNRGRVGTALFYIGILLRELTDIPKTKEAEFKW